MSVAERIMKLRGVMSRNNIDAFLVRHNSNLRWLTGLDGVFDEEEAHAALITPHRLHLHTDSRYAETFRRRFEGTAWHVDAGSEPTAVFCMHGLKGEPNKRLAIEHDITLAEYRKLVEEFKKRSFVVNLIETKDVIPRLRAVKDEGEIAQMRKAQKITDAAFDHMCSWLHEGVTEEQAALELEYFMRKQGSQGIAFPSIVAAGENGASPHAVPGKRVIKRGDMVVMDFGACVADYRADMTRTVSIGQPCDGQREVYDIVKEANKRCREMIRPGVKGSDVHALAVRIIEEAGYGGYFGHGLGHGVGIDIHEMPTLSPRNTAALQPGNVVTVEPGIYLPRRFGVRIEDYGVVTSDGFDCFTESTHELVVL